MSRSSTKVKYTTLDSAIVEIIWLQSFLGELGVYWEEPPTILRDNVEVTYLSATPVLHARTKHIEVNFTSFENMWHTGT